MSCCDLLYRYFTRTRQRIYPHGWCRTFQTSLTDPEDGRGTACGGCKACITICCCSCIQWRMEALVLVVFQHEGKCLLPCLHVVFLLVWCCLPIGWLVGRNGGHMRWSAWISDTDGLLFSSVFAWMFLTVHHKVPKDLRVSAVIIILQLIFPAKTAPILFNCFGFIPEEERSMDHYFTIKWILD